MIKIIINMVWKKRYNLLGSDKWFWPVSIEMGGFLLAYEVYLTDV
jgi:hypothetical protein